MSNIERRIAEVLLNGSFEIKVRNSGVFRFSPSYRFETHNHKEIEINYVRSGHCVIGVEGQFVPLREGDCIILYKGVPHWFLVDTNANCCLTQLEFYVNMPESIKEKLIFLRAGAKYHKLSECGNIELLMENLCRVFRSIKTEDEKKAQLDLGFFQLFIELSSKIEKKLELEQRGKTGKMDGIIQYINENYDGEINVEDLAARFGLSSRYVRKCFVEEIGISCQQYITTLRIGKAKELLWFSSRSVTEIAMCSGFNSSQYFCRVFQKYTEMTPVEYRNLWRGSKAQEYCVVDK
ncbi:MAG: AraC family transcriptional regulator [Clostridiales bacterium]|nr:AraC family transcriptional regulator [Clostridiales bacterium]